MADTLALEKLFDDVVARFAAEGTSVPNLFGWRVPAQQKTTNRIAWIPGDPNGNAGQVGPARNPGRNPRSLATLYELFTVEIFGRNEALPEDEREQYRATRLLRDAWHRAVHLAAYGTFRIQSETWVTDKKERRYGTLLRIVCAIEAMIPDEEFAIAPADSRAVIEVEELDVSETFETAAPPAQAVAASAGPLVLSGEQTVDFFPLVAGDVVLVKDQAAPAQNGLYTVALGAWTRTADVLVHGFFVNVLGGAAASDSGWELSTADPIVVDTTPLTFTRVSP